jgi:HAE1 family hydrophobic/amphiphilic exporter-1
METLNNLTDSSGDTLTMGNREYALHFKGQMESQALMELPIHRYGEFIVRLKDIANINKHLAQDWSYSSINGHRAFYFVISAAKDINALATLEQIKQNITLLNKGPLAKINMKLELSRDDSKAIKKAISQVYTALFLGIILSAVILFYFLRNFRLVTLIFISIPICLSMVLALMKLFGYSLNVISLAGMALSVGLVLDAAIVVIENILRLKRQGLTTHKAIYQGTNEVKSAIISSTFSSIVIFVPILLLKSSESQLFEDLAFTITSALSASLLVALIVLPVLTRFFVTNEQTKLAVQPDSSWVYYLTFSSRSKKRAYTCVTLAVPLALVMGYILMPSIDVLPDPKQRMIITYITINDPMSPDATYQNIVTPIKTRIQQQKNNPTAPDYEVTGTLCFDNFCLLYFYPAAGWHYPDFKNWVETTITQDLSGVSIFSLQSSLLRFALPGNRATQLDIQGGNLEELQHAGTKILKGLKEAFPNANIRESTPLDNKAARIEFTPDYEQLMYYGMSRDNLNRHLLALTQGSFLGRFYTQGDTYPFYFKGHSQSNIDQLLATEIYIENFGLRPLSQLVSAKLGLAPESILRINREATVSFYLTPPENMTVGDFAYVLNQEMKNIMTKNNLSYLHVSFRGSTDRLSLFLQEFFNMFIFSVIILLLLLWLSLSSWKLAFAVLLSMPISLFGGMATLKLMNLFVVQNLDVITMIGFIILMGLVINNAILLANKYKQGVSLGISQQQAITDAVASRKRPIYMSTGTTIFGMLPLVLSPGEGAEIYRGLAAVIIGGMTFSALFSLSFMSALLSLPIYAAEQPKLNFSNAV